MNQIVTVRSLSDALHAAGFHEKAEELLGRKFKLAFATKTFGYDTASTRSFNRHDIIGTVEGIQWDQSLDSLIVEISNRRCGLDGCIRSVVFDFSQLTWTVDLEFPDFDLAHGPTKTAELKMDYPVTFYLIPR